MGLLLMFMKKFTILDLCVKFGVLEFWPQTFIESIVFWKEAHESYAKQCLCLTVRLRNLTKGDTDVCFSPSVLILNGC